MKHKSQGEGDPPQKLSFASFDSDNDSDDSGVESGSPGDSHSGSDSESDHKTPVRPSKKPKAAKITASDVRIARETSELFKSNIFKMQIDALLKEIAIPDKYFASANKLLYTLRDTIVAAKPGKEYPISTVNQAVPNKIPFPSQLFQQPQQPHLKFQFEPPTDVNVVGSYSLKNSVRQPEGIEIDLVVVLPSSLFESKDYLNYRYFDKRAFYLAVVANTIVNADIGVKVRYDFLRGDRLRPVLRLELAGKLGKYFSILVHFGLEPHVFSSHKLTPERNCVRSVEGPTPSYNHSLLCDLSYQPLLAYLHNASAQCAEFTNACKLARLWSRQRSLPFSHFHFAVLMAALLNGGPQGKRVLLHGYSSYQLFKGVLLFLANNELDLKFDLNETTQTAMQGCTLEHGSLGLNILDGLPQWSLELLRHEAKVSVDLLQDVAVDRFADLFLKHQKFSLKYDISIDVHLEVDSILATSDRLNKALRYACGDRVQAIAFQSSVHGSSWSLSSLPDLDSELTLTVGVLLDPEHSEKRVTFGPAPNEPGQDVFKKFWCGKSSLRRFQDGKISEAVVWRQGSRSIVHDIVDFVVSNHFEGSVEKTNLVDSVLPLPKHAESAITSLSLWQAKINVFNDLARHLMELTLPLRVSSVYGISSSLRYTSIAEPTPYDATCDDTFGQGIIQLESSGRWPDDAEAIEKTKIAFLITTAQELRKRYEATVGVEPSLVTGGIETGFLLVQVEGFAFKLRIATERDDRLYKNLGEEAALALKRVGPAAADHHRMVSSAALKYPFYSPTVRVLKLWFRKHLLASHITEEAIELVALKVFLDSAPFVPPNSVNVAFCRTLDFLSNWNWKEQPMVLDFGQDQLVSGTAIEPTAYSQIMATWSAKTKGDPAFTLAPYFIASKADPTGILWTQALPRSRVGLMVAMRTTVLARNCLTLKIPSHMFKPALQDFDVEIKLENPSVQARPKFKNLANISLKDMIANSANTGAEFYKDISGAFQGALTLFYSGSLDDKSKKSQLIMGIWNKEAVPQKYRVGIPYSVEPRGDEVVLNKAAIVEEISRLGSSMVTVVRF